MAGFLGARANFSQTKGLVKGGVMMIWSVTHDTLASDHANAERKTQDYRGDSRLQIDKLLGFELFHVPKRPQWKQDGCQTVKFNGKWQKCWSTKPFNDQGLSLWHHNLSKKSNLSCTPRCHGSWVVFQSIVLTFCHWSERDFEPTSSHIRVHVQTSDPISRQTPSKSVSHSFSLARKIVGSH